MPPRRRTDMRRVVQRADAGQPGATAMRTTPIRTTVDLQPDVWGELQLWQVHTGNDLRRKVTTKVVLQALVGLLLDDPDVADRVRERVRQAVSP